MLPVPKAERGKLDRAKYTEALAPAQLTAADMKNRDVVLAALPWLVEWHQNLEEAVRAQRTSNGGQQRGIKRVARDMAKYVSKLSISLFYYIILTT